MERGVPRVVHVASVGRLGHSPPVQRLTTGTVQLRCRGSFSSPPLSMCATRSQLAAHLGQVSTAAVRGPCWLSQSCVSHVEAGGGAPSRRTRCLCHRRRPAEAALAAPLPGKIV